MMRSVSGFTGWAGLLLIAAVAVAGCARIVWIPEPAPIAVPDNLSSDEVGTVLRRAIIHTGGGEFGGHGWRVDEDKPGELIVSTRPRNHYLQLAVEYDEVYVTTQIIDSEKLHHSDTAIHSRAIDWKNQLEDHLQRALYEEALNRREAQP